MKNIFFFFFFSLLSSYCFAQKTLNQEDAQVATDRVVQLYQLDKLQRTKVLEIQKRKFRNLSEIEQIQDTQPEMFLKKKQYIAKARQSGIKKILYPEQLSAFEREQKKLEEKKSKKIAELKEQGVSKRNIQLAVIALELEEY